jgi:hypothetical protein
MTATGRTAAGSAPWPELPLEAWRDTYATLHMWTQMVGKIRLALTPRVNHWWNVPLYPSIRGLTTSPMLCGGRFFEIEFDFVGHRLDVRRQDGAVRSLALAPRSVADFHGELMGSLGSLGLSCSIWPVPVEVPDPVPFPEDHGHCAYDPEYANRFWRILLGTGRVLEEFRAGFTGKCSPVHFFWGSFDLAVTRFSGRRAPEREGADPITREAYSHEAISHGFWPGIRQDGTADDGMVREAAFYAYAAPEPTGLDQAPIHPEAAFYSPALKEFILRYDDMRSAPSPEKALMAFLESTYDRAAALARWDTEGLRARTP